MKKLHRKKTEPLHSIFDMQRRIVTLITIITPKIHTNKKINNLSRFVMQKNIVTYTLLILCNYCNYYITDSDFVCNFSCKCYVSNVIFLSGKVGVTS